MTFIIFQANVDGLATEFFLRQVLQQVIYDSEMEDLLEVTSRQQTKCYWKSNL